MASQPRMTCILVDRSARIPRLILYIFQKYIIAEQMPKILETRKSSSSGNNLCLRKHGLQATRRVLRWNLAGVSGLQTCNRIMRLLMTPTGQRQGIRTRLMAAMEKQWASCEPNECDSHL